MASPSRRIVHLDMDAFYASVEQRDNSSLSGNPVVVGGRPEGRGVVAAASYEARAFGIHSAMPMSKALRLCPHLEIIRPNFKKYKEVSLQIFEIFRRVTPLVEPLSLDEAYLDVTENTWGETLATPVARKLKRQIKDYTGLTASAGVAPNKFLAKIASGWQKPDGLTVIPHQKVESFLHKLPVSALWGVGPVTTGRLRSHGINKLVDIRNVNNDDLLHLVGKQARWLKQLAYGRDDRRVNPNRVRKSKGSECTYPEDIKNIDIIKGELDRMARQAAGWLELHKQFARTITIKVRYSDFTTITRSHSKSKPTRDAEAIVARAFTLLKKTEAREKPLRLIGLSVSALEDSDQMPDSVSARDPLLWDSIDLLDTSKCL